MVEHRIKEYHSIPLLSIQVARINVSCDVLPQPDEAPEVNKDLAAAFAELNRVERVHLQMLASADPELVELISETEHQRVRLELEVLRQAGGIREEDYFRRDKELSGYSGKLSEQFTGVLTDSDADKVLEEEIEQHYARNDFASMAVACERRAPLKKARMGVTENRSIKKSER